MELKFRSMLRRLLDERNMSVVTLAKETEISKNTLHNWLSGQSPKNLEDLKKVADFFKVTVDILLWGKVESSKYCSKCKLSTGLDFEDKLGQSLLKQITAELSSGNYEVILRRRVEKN